MEFQDLGRNYSSLVNMSFNLSTQPPEVAPNITLSPDMIFSSNNILSITAYTIFMVIAGTGNLTVLLTLLKNPARLQTRVNLFIIHLCIADLTVAFIMMPTEIASKATVSWNAGDIPCRVLMFFRAFGLYLSSFILVTISLDRYFAITRPLSLGDADRRGKIMLTLAWIFSVVASIPQSVIFHLEPHPSVTWFKQCVTFHFFPSEAYELAYNLFHMTALYLLPLIVIILSYTLIICEISRKTRSSGSKEDKSKRHHKPLVHQTSSSSLRRSGLGKIERAKARTLKMTIVIVSVFIVCWTPYFVMSAWWWFDQASAQKIDMKVQQCLFLFAVSNSCMNPIVYGVFSTNCTRQFRQCCCVFGVAAQRKQFTASMVTRTTRLDDKTEVDQNTKKVATSSQQPTSPSVRMKLLKRMDSSITFSESPPTSSIQLNLANTADQ